MVLANSYKTPQILIRATSGKEETIRFDHKNNKKA